MIDLTQFKPGDIVRCEFASPAKGWIEAEVAAEPYPSDFRLEINSGAIEFMTADFTSITKVEPPIQAGDVVWFDGHWHAVRFTRMDDGPLVVHRSDGLTPLPRSIDDIPDDAIWLVRGGKLNPLLAGE